MTSNGGLTDLSRDLVARAREVGCKIVTAESCTAGALATLLADTPSSGNIFLGAIVSYAKIGKNELLGVSADLLHRCTAVSEHVASAMTEGALQKCAAADFVIAVTGVCGPQPDEDGNPVGLAFIATQKRGETAAVHRHQLATDSAGHIRGELMRLALEHALNAMAP